MNIWPDHQLLRTASYLVKKFNWLTGKDNFWLSYQLILAGGTIFTIYLYILLHDILGTVLASVMTLAFVGLIKTMEEAQIKFSETKSLEVELSFLSIRLTFLISSLMCIFTSLFVFLFPRGAIDNGLIFVDMWVIFWTIALYSASIEKPPFSISKAWEWLKEASQFRSMVLRPIPVKN